MFQSIESRVLPVGLFFNKGSSVLKGITGGVQNETSYEYVTFGDLKSYIEKKIKKYTSKKGFNKQVPYTAGDYTGNFLLAVGRPKNEIQSVIRKYKKKQQMFHSRILYDTKNKKINQVFYIKKKDFTHEAATLNEILKMTYDYTDDAFTAKQYNLKDELVFTNGVYWKPKTYEIKKICHPKKEHFVCLSYDGEKNILLKEFYKIGYPRTEQQIFKISNRYENNQLVEQKFLNEQNELINNEEGIAKVVYGYDSFGNLIKKEFYNSEGQLQNDKDEIAKYRYAYRRKEKIKEEHYNKKGLARYKYYKRGNDIWEEFYNRRGILKTNKNPSIILRKYDAAGKLIKTVYMDADKEPQEDHYGNHKIVYEWKSFKKPKKKIYYSLSGIHTIVTFKYDRNHLKILEEYWDSTGKKLKEDRVYKIARYKFEYFSNGKLKKESYYGKRGKLKNNRFGYASIDYIYNNTNQLIRKVYNTRNGDLKKRGVAIKEFKYDEIGRLIQKIYKNSNHKPVANKEGISTVEYRYSSMLNTHLKLESIEHLSPDKELIKYDYKMTLSPKNKKDKILIQLDKFYRPIEILPEKQLENVLLMP